MFGIQDCIESWKQIAEYARNKTEQCHITQRKYTDEIWKSRPSPYMFHQIWFDLGNGSLPPQKYASHQQSWKTHHPSAQFLLWNEDMARQLLQKHYMWFLPIYDSYREAIYRIDAIRPFILHHYGGAYIDMDLGCTRPISQLLDTGQIVLCRDRIVKNMINNFFMVGPRGHPFWVWMMSKLAIRSSSILHQSQSLLGTLYVAGPWMLHHCVNTYHDPKQLFILPYEAFSSEHTHWPGNYGWHEYGVSWGIPKKALYDQMRFIIVPLMIIAMVILIWQLSRIHAALPCIILIFAFIAWNVLHRQIEKMSDKDWEKWTLFF